MSLVTSSATRSLRTLSRETGFYFFTSYGNYTGISAMSMEDFLNKLEEVSVTSLEFHLYRGDFERWASDVLEDTKLSDRISAVKLLEPVDSSLREQLVSVVSTRLEELKTANPQNC
ncbi:MAG: DUF5752 family protein [Candidatus Bathyarchaeia archaeon]|jgi:hypothetical protein